MNLSSSWRRYVVLFALSCSSVWAAGREAVFSEAKVSSEKNVSLRIQLPEGFKLNDSAPHRLELMELATKRVVRTWREKSIRFPEMALGRIPASSHPYQLEGRIFVCDKVDQRICVRLKARQQIFSGSSIGPSILDWKLSVPAGAQVSTGMQ